MTPSNEHDAAKEITHGRHCICSACAREDWTNPQLAPCGMHGSDCPRAYQPLGRPGDLVSDAAKEGEPVRPSVISPEVRKAIRSAIHNLAEYREIPPERFPGHKGIACANLEGFLGRFTVPVLDALETAEDALLAARQVDEAMKRRAADAIGRKVHWLKDDDRALELARAALHAALDIDDETEQTIAEQAEEVRSLAIRFTEQEAELHRLREAAEAVLGAWNKGALTSLMFAPIDRLRAVLTPESKAER